MKLQNAWHSNAKWIWLLSPLTGLFWLLSAIRRKCFTLGLIKQSIPQIPVIVVGNISVGGNGKTPLTLALVDYLHCAGYRPAVLSRGYGGSQKEFPFLVMPHCDPAVVGDEPSLIAKRLNCVVLIDPKRVRGCEFIANNTQANIIVCDDGLQHYAMARKVELCVVDKRGLGNGYLMPMGPLREGSWRLDTVNLLIYNQGFSSTANLPMALVNASKPIFKMELKATAWVNVKTGEKFALQKAMSDELPFNKNTVTAIAGIGDPQRFFDTLSMLHIETAKCIAFDDHHAFTKTDIPPNGVVLMTEKDAVKCAKFAHKNCWYLQIDAQLPTAFFEQIITDIDSPH